MELRQGVGTVHGHLYNRFQLARLVTCLTGS
jgi:hypothetical protein